MRTDRYRSQLIGAIGERQAWRIAAAILLASNLALAAGLAFNAGNERTVIVPPEIHKTFWVENDRVSREYLEEMSVWFAQTGLTVSPDSADYQAQRFLRRTSPRARGALKTRLALEAGRLKRNDASQVFYLSKGIAVDERGMQTAVSGTLVTLIGDKQVKSEDKTFRIRFSMESGEIRVTEFTDEVNADDPFGKKEPASGGSTAAADG